MPTPSVPLPERKGEARRTTAGREIMQVHAQTNVLVALLQAAGHDIASVKPEQTEAFIGRQDCLPHPTEATRASGRASSQGRPEPSIRAEGSG